ncbi:fumarate hydratase [Echinicola jeungdonensis]|uniref:Helix-turn-helix transcriptional regulator n=1 Tax=Echinicola jeungdonensis TaxID=709343 RepID=A0ABV5J3Z3_9BACT|nr:fumarate hydratase [Echinicola jeungdonensis]MDN3670642.1 fumarate hydratase [Echinicola jeungdonensis]
MAKQFQEIKAVISGDVISSTSLVEEDRVELEKRMAWLLGFLEDKFGVFGRIIKGDYLECVVGNPANALRVALAIKSFVKAFEVQSSKNSKINNRIKLFKTHGIRLAVGLGELSRFDPDKGIIDGEAVYLSGRLINVAHSHNKERVVIKSTLFFASSSEALNEQFQAMFALLDELISKATARQSEVLFWKLMGENESEIAERLDISQSVVNQHSTSLGWNGIEKAVDYFNKTIQEK